MLIKIVALFVLLPATSANIGNSVALLLGNREESTFDTFVFFATLPKSLLPFPSKLGAFFFIIQILVCHVGVIN